MFEVINDDCLTVLKSWEASTIDSIIADPPYGISFMGKHWDYDVPGVEVWKECLRVLKPGGHILVACGTRTQHRMAVNIEDAGFEIRDLIAWVYGSGFPKSLNVGKQIDKSFNVERTEVIGIKQGHEEFADRGNKSSVQSFKGTLGGNGGFSIPWMEDPEKIENYHKQFAPVTEQAKEFEGWGTALKPAMELWTLARKPFTGTVASNVLEWGTGGLNIDGCRVEFKNEADKKESVTKNQHANFNSHDGIRVPTKGIYHGDNRAPENYNPVTGRFPANFIHDGSEEVVGLFPESSITGNRIKYHKRTPAVNTPFTMGNPFCEYTDRGSAARFFYCAKASKRERDAGLEGFSEKLKLTQMRSANGTGEKNFEGGFNDQIMKNNHPTVKPIALMRYLCRLITPKNGIVLDPFAGSGSTGCGAVLEGFNFIGIEREPEYAEIAKARIVNYIKQHDIPLQHSV